MKLIQVCTTDELPEGEALKIENDGTPIAVFNSGGEFLAVDEQCTHGEWSLCDGFIENGEVECPLHGAKFCLKTGAVLAPPASRALRVFPVKIEGDRVYVDVEGGHYEVEPVA